MTGIAKNTGEWNHRTALYLVRGGIEVIHVCLSLASLLASTLERLLHKLHCAQKAGGEAWEQGYKSVLCSFTGMVAY